MSNLSWLTNAQVDRLKPFSSESRGKPRADDLHVPSGIISINRNGLRWCDALWEYGSAKTRWKRWSDNSVFARIMVALADENPAHKTIMIDATHLKAHRTTCSLRAKRGLDRRRSNERRHEPKFARP
jgi:transposase